eukprot:1638264-Amphidinium_carterae.2
MSNAFPSLPSLSQRGHERNTLTTHPVCASEHHPFCVGTRLTPPAALSTLAWPTSTDKRPASNTLLSLESGR